MITPQNVIRHEVIGLLVTVTKASNPSYVGMKGTIIDETKHTLRIQTSSGAKIVPKHRSVFRLTLPQETVVDVEGSALISPPEKRTTMRIHTPRGK
ncbi:MAG: ribonuclease P protein component 1 [Methanomicrobiales archaeon]|nr:ribonuclease P protein component 1 [Methanomicrobiales archaeon]